MTDALTSRLTDEVLAAADSECGRVYREYMTEHPDVRIMDFPPEVTRAARAATRAVLVAALGPLVEENERLRRMVLDAAVSRVTPEAQADAVAGWDDDTTG